MYQSAYSPQFYHPYCTSISHAASSVPPFHPFATMQISFCLPPRTPRSTRSVNIPFTLQHPHFFRTFRSLDTRIFFVNKIENHWFFFRYTIYMFRINSSVFVKNYYELKLFVRNSHNFIPSQFMNHFFFNCNSFVRITLRQYWVITKAVRSTSVQQQPNQIRFRFRSP